MKIYWYMLNILGYFLKLIMKKKKKNNHTTSPIINNKN